MAKKKITVTVDEDLVAFIHQAGGESLSAVVNAALANEIERRGRHAALGELLAHWEALDGPVLPELAADARAAFDEVGANLGAA
jgi:hypothetical protein